MQSAATKHNLMTHLVGDATALLVYRAWTLDCSRLATYKALRWLFSPSQPVEEQTLESCMAVHPVPASASFAGNLLLASLFH